MKLPKFTKRLRIEAILVRCTMCGNEWTNPKDQKIDCPVCHGKGPLGGQAIRPEQIK